MKKTFLIIAASIGLLFACDENPNQQYAGPRGNGPQEVVRVDTVVKVVNEAFIASNENKVSYNNSNPTGFANNKLDGKEKELLSTLVGNTIGNTNDTYGGYIADATAPIAVAISKSNSEKIDSVFIVLEEIRTKQNQPSARLNYENVARWCKLNGFELKPKNGWQKN